MLHDGNWMYWYTLVSDRMISVAAGAADVHVTHLLVEAGCVGLRRVASSVAAAGRMGLGLKMLLLVGLTFRSCTFKEPTLFVVVRSGIVRLLVRHLRITRGRLLLWMRAGVTA